VGLLFDNKLTFIPHLKSLKIKCLKAMNVMKVLAKIKNKKMSAYYSVLLRTL